MQSSTNSIFTVKSISSVTSDCISTLTLKTTRGYRQMIIGGNTELTRSGVCGAQTEAIFNLVI
jgi:hypothetical protein